MTRYSSFSEADTEQIAAGLAQNARAGDIICLSGGLGMGKTVFARGFARALGYKQDITSPTFTLLIIYRGGKLPLYHFDLYRLDNPEAELEGIGYEDYFFAQGVCIIEWAEKARRLIPDGALWVAIASSGNEREIVLS